MSWKKTGKLGSENENLPSVQGIHVFFANSIGPKLKGASFSVGFGLTPITEVQEQAFWKSKRSSQLWIEPNDPRTKLSLILFHAA
jgi:hypothetical protein